MEIHHTEQENRGSFYIQEGYELLAQMTYSLGEGTVIIEHTEVSEKLQGKQVGIHLLERAADHTRAMKRKLVALCPFAKAMLLKKHNEFKDIC